MSNNKTQFCPICKAEVYFMPRYPKYVCAKCIDTGTFTKDGKEITFYNIDFSGGFMSKVDGKKGQEHECFIKGIKCYADEARFGGIVIQTKN